MLFCVAVIPHRQIFCQKETTQFEIFEILRQQKGYAAHVNIEGSDGLSEVLLVLGGQQRDGGSGVRCSKPTYGNHGSTWPAPSWIPPGFTLWPT